MKAAGVWPVLLSAALLLAACAPAPPSPTSPDSSTLAPTSSASTSPTGAAPATLIIRQRFSESGFYTEGAFAYVELFEADGRVVQRWETMDYHLDRELVHVTVARGRYDLRSYVRPCEAACPALDGPMAACNVIINLGAGETVTIEIDRRLRTCEAKRV